MKTGIVSPLIVDSALVQFIGRPYIISFVKWRSNATGSDSFLNAPESVRDKECE